MPPVLPVVLVLLVLLVLLILPVLLVLLVPHWHHYCTASSTRTAAVRVAAGAPPPGVPPGPRAGPAHGVAAQRQRRRLPQQPGLALVLRGPQPGAAAQH